MDFFPLIVIQNWKNSLILALSLNKISHLAY